MKSSSIPVPTHRGGAECEEMVQVRYALLNLQFGSARIGLESVLESGVCSCRDERLVDGVLRYIWDQVKKIITGCE